MMRPDLGPERIEGRLIALRKALALLLSRLPPSDLAALFEHFEHEALQTGDEDPAAVVDAVAAVAGAMALELAALRDEADRQRTRP